MNTTRPASLTDAQEAAADRLETARRRSNHAAHVAHLANNRFAQAAADAAKAETDRNAARAASTAATTEHLDALAAAVALGYRHSHRIDATEADDWSHTDKRSPKELAAAYPRHTQYTEANR